MNKKYFPWFGFLEYIECEVYFNDADAEYFSAFGEWDIVRLSDGVFYYTKIVYD